MRTYRIAGFDSAGGECVFVIDCDNMYYEDGYWFFTRKSGDHPDMEEVVACHHGSIVDSIVLEE